MIKILADQNIYKLKEFLPENIELTSFDPALGIPELSGFNALFVRTVSKIDQSVIPDIPQSLKLIGTGSSGSDHIDRDYFEQAGLQVVDAKGSNADAVSEYIITSLLLWSFKKDKDLKNLKVGIIGAGKTGSAVQRQCKVFGIETVSYDPPKSLRDSTFKSCTLNELLDCDILTFHVPLTKKGDNRTFHWLNAEKLNGNKFELILNASRGGVIDELALIEAIDNNTVKNVVIDVWEYEPDFNTALVEKAFIATPHIAGYSEQAKLNASKILVQKLVNHINLKMPNPQKLYSSKVLNIANLNYSLYELLLRLHPLREYDANIRDLCLRPDKAILFQKLRTDRPYRYEYPFIKLNKLNESSNEILQKLGVTFV